jgi:hypothetical protein
MNINDSAFKNAVPKVKASMINEGCLHVNASLQKLAAELKVLTTWLRQYPELFSEGKITSLDINTTDFLQKSFEEKADTLQSQVIDFNVAIDQVTKHLAIKNQNPL